MSKGKYRAKDQQQPEPMQGCSIPDVPEADDDASITPSSGSVFADLGLRVFCVDCTHYHTIPPYHYCKASPPNLVTGAKEELECRWMREMPVCGPEGNLFEPAGPATPVLKYEG